jgi:hypothetical protein
MHFVFVRPESIKAHKRPYPVVKPDLDKLMRAVLDSLTGVIYVDDSQVVKAEPTKDYGPRESVTIHVEAIEAEPMLPLDIAEPPADDWGVPMPILKPASKPGKVVKRAKIDDSW